MKNFYLEIKHFKYIFIALLAFVSVWLKAQPTVFYTDANATAVSGFAITNSRILLVDKGAFRQAIFQNTPANDNKKWAFHIGTQSSANYTTNWRPYQINSADLALNTITAPNTTNPGTGALYNSNGGQDGNWTGLTNNHYVTVNITENTSSNNHMAVWETSYLPNTLSGASHTAGSTTVTLGSDLATGENMFVRASTDAFTTSTISQVTFSGTAGTFSFPALCGTISYYFYTSSQSLSAINSSVTTHGQLAHDMSSFYIFNSSGSNYTTVKTSVGGSVAGGATVCSGINSTTLTLSGHTGSVTKWQSSTVSDFSSGVTDITTNTTTTLIATNLTATTYYRAVVQSGACTVANSSGATVTVNPLPTAPIASVIQPTCTVSTATITVVSPPISGLSFSLDGSNYSNTTVFSAVASNATYSLTAKNNSNNCVSLPTSITIDAQPNCSNPVIPTSGLVAYYPFNGNADDATSFTNNGSITGATLTTDRFCNANSAYSFDGNDYIQAPDATQLRSNNLTVSVWVYNLSNGINSIIDKAIGSSNCDSWVVFNYNSNFAASSCFDSGSGYTSLLQTPNTKEVWTNLIYVIDDNNNRITFYKDGALVGDAVFTQSLAYDSRPLLIGMAYESGTLQFPFNGKIDDIRIYNRALNAAEIKALANETALTKNIKITAFLAGPLDAATGKMNDALRSLSLIPTTSPYGGGETINSSVLGASQITDNNIVDWVEVQLRTSPTATPIKKAALIQRDGDIVDLDGVSLLSICAVAGSYHVAVLHRNHLGVMTAGGLIISNNAVTVVDFTDASMTTTYGTNAQKGFLIGQNAVMAMWAGDATGRTGDKSLTYSADRLAIKTAIGSNIQLLGVYNDADTNMDGNVLNTGKKNDRQVILKSLEGQASRAQTF
jgi:Concanavalin A-like lectin/glucanases superfamily